jgi:hypothetical protein
MARSDREMIGPRFVYETDFAHHELEPDYDFDGFDSYDVHDRFDDRFNPYPYPRVGQCL